MVGAGEIFPGKVVQLRADSLGETTRVGKDDRGVVVSDLTEQLGVDGRPYRSGGGVVRIERIRLSRLVHVFDGDNDLEVELTIVRDVDDGDRSRVPFPVFDRATPEKSSDGVQWALGSR